MTREPHEPHLTPEQEQEVRRLLVDARHTAPVPEDVATRLDRVLAELAAGEHPAPVTVLATHRRRRATTMLVAAAAVVAVGVGLGQVVGAGNQGASDNPAASSAESSRERSAQQDSPAGGTSSLAGADSADGYAVPRPVRVREQHFSTDVRHARRVLLSTLRSAAKDQANDQAGTESYNATNGAVVPCARGHWGSGRLVAASYAGQPAVLVFRAVAGETQVVDLFACGADVALRSITLPAP